MMFRVLLSDGTVRELPEGANSTIENRWLVCRDATGAIIRRFEPLAVLAYGLAMPLT